VKITRRKLAGILAAAPALASASQTTADQPDLLKIARDRMKSNSDALAKEPIPMSTEPAVTFRAE